MEREMQIVNLDEIAGRWQIPVDVVKTFVTEHGMNPAQPEEWGVKHWDMLMQEKQKAFEESLFPGPFRPEPTETTT